MTTYIAFLRGINVSGQKIIKMAALKKMFEAMGFKNVRTYIQSGNVAFESPAVNAETLCKKIENGLQAALGYRVSTAIRTEKEIEDIIKNNPFKKEIARDDVRLYVTMLSAVPEGDKVKELESTESETDEFRFKNREIYILCREGYAETVFSNNFIEKKLGVKATSRNWNTMNKILTI
jgi:uncharacterized protein (DUF1697 family)